MTTVGAAMFAGYYLGLSRLKRVLVVLGVLGCIPCKTALATEINPAPEVTPDLMVGLKLSVPFSKLPARVGIEFRGGAFIRVHSGTALLVRTGGSTFIDGGKDGIRFGLTGYTGTGMGDFVIPILAIDFDAGFVIGSAAVPQGWLVSAQMEIGQRLRGTLSYDVVKPFDQTKNDGVKYLSLTLGASPLKLLEY